MRLTELCSGARLESIFGPGGVEVAGDAEVRRVVEDSRRAQDGDCFVAVRGTATDGHRYIAQAVAAGCTAVVCEDPTAVPPGTARAVVADTRRAIGPLAQAALGWPSRRLRVVGVTGTNGKTTFTYLLREILAAVGRRVGLFGTVVYDTTARTARARTTTPGAVELAELMAEAAAAGATDLLMEVSSHALDQRRTDGIELAVGVFTNLTLDHLDYHGTMEDYAAAKRRLFESLRPGATAVLNRDDPHSEEMASAAGEGTAKLWYGLSPAADLYAQVRAVDLSGSRFVINWAGRSAEVATALVGRHNVLNCLAAAAAAVALGVELEVIASALGRVSCVPGRLQRVPAEVPFHVLVDYAHTDDALKNVLSALAPIKGDGRLILVFGCGGDRDRTKRPRMAAVAEGYADHIFVTSDNPRSEEPMAIIEEILTGFSALGRSKLRVEPDRRKAIAAALDAARPGDVVLIAGKGHEDYQIIGSRRVHFDDLQTAGELLRRRGL